jgi:hypothetical protein
MAREFAQREIGGETFHMVSDAALGYVPGSKTNVEEWVLYTHLLVQWIHLIQLPMGRGQKRIQQLQAGVCGVLH